MLNDEKTKQQRVFLKNKKIKKTLFHREMRKAV